MSERTYRRWIQHGRVVEDKRPFVKRPVPSNKFTDEEREAILTACNQPEYASLPPSQIVPRLLDKGIYFGSESSFYRILRQHKQLNRRGRSRAPEQRHKPASFQANGPNEVWSWDITYMPTKVKGQFYYLYLFEDIYSRKLVGYEVYEDECGEKAAHLLHRCLFRESCVQRPLVLHSDNGAPMKSLTMKAKMEDLKITPSYNRPRVSNDNPYSEATFRTLKYRPEWPVSGFASLEEAREWVERFVCWYNNEHRHSGIKFITPSQRHNGEDVEILKNRKAVLNEARSKHPNRWSGQVRDCTPEGSVMLNPDRPKKEVA